MHNTIISRGRLWQLISPTLPVGAYAYSAGLEYAVDIGWIKDEAAASDWITGQLQNNLTTLDVPVLTRLYAAWKTNDTDEVKRWNHFLLASRESSELLAEDRQLGNALAQLLPELGIEEAINWRIETNNEEQTQTHTSFATMFALGAARWGIPLNEAVQGYLWAWCENQVAAAIKLVPLGQTAGQRILSHIVECLPDAMDRGLSLDDDDIGAVSPGVALACAKHETQYSRLFRS
jgi:urease accessory protein